MATTQSVYLNIMNESKDDQGRQSSKSMRSSTHQAWIEE